MRYHTFGATGLRVSSAFLGSMTFGDRDGKGADLQESRRILDTYADAGGNVIDTAVNYRGGQSETILGELLHERRDSFVLATKYTASREHADPNAAGNHRKNLRLSLDLSLRRLRTDHIDLYWVHMWDRWTPIEETMRALDDEVRAGRLLYVGISDTPAWVLARANTLAEWKGWSPFVGLQIPYNLTQRDVERELLPAADHLGVSIAAWSPLAGGLLTGKYTRTDGQSPTGSTRHAPSGLSDSDLGVARLVDDVAAQLGLTPSQVAIAWTTARRARIHPILGARTSAQLHDNLAAVDLTLPEDALDRLDAATAPRLGFPTDFIDETTPWVFAAADLGSPQPNAMAR